MTVKPKKKLGQHFLHDQNIARKIVNSLHIESSDNILEIGPGTGVLTRFLLDMKKNIKVVEIDTESVDYLKLNYPDLEIIEADFLTLKPEHIFKTSFSIIGNFPYNISSQIFFKILSYREQVNETVCMIQKEVADRICAPKGSKTYGILSVLLQTFFDIEYLFTVGPGVFIPPPKVNSAVIRLTNKHVNLEVDEAHYFKIIKQSFNQRRKTLRNSLKSLLPLGIELSELGKRPEQLDFTEFINLTKKIPV